MSIICKICNGVFDKIIPWQHLKTHNISSAEYKITYGPIFSNETKEKMSTRVPHNKGKKITDPDALQKIKESMIKREIRFRNGEFTRGSAKTLKQKQVLSLRTKEYAASHKKEMCDRAKKAIFTKIENNYDFGKNMRGKHHSVETKEKLKVIRDRTNIEKTKKSQLQITELINTCNLTLNNSLSDNIFNLTCNVCNTQFTFSRQYFTLSKTFSEMCPTCFPRIIRQSKSELELFEFIKSLYPDAISGYRKTYHSKEIDIFIPSKNIGFEFNGLYWHSEKVLIDNGKYPTSDFDKYQYFLQQGIRIISIFADEWTNKNNIVKSRITNILQKTTDIIYARKCEVRIINSTDASKFIKDNHIMGNGRSNIRLGLFYKDELISVMTFTNNNLSRKLKDIWEINRFASKLNTSVVGGASRLFSKFISLEQPTKIISYADNRWSDGNLYHQLGFVKESVGTPNYWYFAPPNKIRIHRYSLRKNKFDDQSLTEYENRLKQGYLRIWDCGSSKWIWTPQKSPE